MFKKILKSTALVLGAIIAAFLFFAGGTQIYKFILGMDVQLVGTEWELDEPIVPGEVIETHPAAENNSKRSGAYVFISVTLACSDSVPADSVAVDSAPSYASDSMPADEGIVDTIGEGISDAADDSVGVYTDIYDFEVSDSWTLVDEERADGKVTYTFAYGTEDGLTILPAGETTPPLTDSFKFTPYDRLENLDPDAGRIEYKILSVASATYNADGKTAEEAWKELRRLR